MNKLKFGLLGGLFIAVLASCQKEEVEHEFSYQEGDATISVQDVDGEPFFFVKGDITTEFEMTANKNWVIDGAVQVKDGGVLKIQPGTFIYGNVSSEPSYLAVTSTGSISAVGTTTERIIFSSINEKIGVPSIQDWGGIYMNGEKTSDVSGIDTDETDYGVFIQNDGSGSIQHTEIHYAERSVVVD